MTKEDKIKLRDLYNSEYYYKTTRKEFLAKAEQQEKIRESLRNPRSCRDCGVAIGKGKQYCESCRKIREKSRNKRYWENYKRK